MASTAGHARDGSDRVAYVLVVIAAQELGGFEAPGVLVEGLRVLGHAGAAERRAPRPANQCLRLREVFVELVEQELEVADPHARGVRRRRRAGRLVGVGDHSLGLIDAGHAPLEALEQHLVRVTGAERVEAVPVVEHGVPRPDITGAVADSVLPVLDAVGVAIPLATVVGAAHPVEVPDVERLVDERRQDTVGNGSGDVWAWDAMLDNWDSFNALRASHPDKVLFQGLEWGVPGIDESATAIGDAYQQPARRRRRTPRAWG